MTFLERTNSIAVVGLVGAQAASPAAIGAKIAWHNYVPLDIILIRAARFPVTVRCQSAWLALLRAMMKSREEGGIDDRTS
jgi:hypothetical protein